MLEETRPVLWTQGLFLQPQHFQISDMVAESRLRTHIRHATPWAWGFRSLDLSHDALLNSQISVNSLNAVFQDGSEVSAPGNALVRPRSFENAWTQPDRPFMVYLGLRRFNPNASNVFSHEEGQEPPSPEKNRGLVRYQSSYSPQPSPDIHGDAQPETVRRLSFILGIYWESEINDVPECDFLPMARLIRVGDKPVVDQSYIPPSLNTNAFPVLQQALRDIRDQLLGRAARLEEYKPATNHSDHAVADPKYFAMLLTLMILNRHIPYLSFAANHGDGPPWLSYLRLRELAAELSSLVPGFNALGENEQGEKLIPDYDHSDPGFCFRRAHQLVTTLLASLSTGPEHMIRLERGKGGLFAATPPESFFTPDMHYFLMIRGSMKPEVIGEEATRFGKLGSLKSMGNLIAQALPGVPLRVVTPPAGLPRRVDAAYLEINHNSPLWKEVIQLEDKTLAFSWQEAGEDTVAHLVALKAR